MSPSLSNLSLHLFLLSNLTNITMASDPRSETVVFRLSSDCQPNYVRLDGYDRVEVTSNTDYDRPSPVDGVVTCTSHFMTGHHDHGICIHSNDLYFKRPGVDITFYTSKLGPEKVLRRGVKDFRQWCTKEPLVTMEINTSGYLSNQDEEFRYSFLVTNRTQQELQNTYYLDSFKYCDLFYKMESGEEVVIVTQRYPSTTDLPLSCQLSLLSLGTEEYEELCVTVEDYSMENNCMASLEVEGFMDRFWPKSESLGCNDQSSALKKEEMCSSNKELVLKLTRSNETDTGFFAKAVIKSKKHPKWETLSQESVELQGLGFMKGLTFFIATVDILSALVAVVLATMCRHPMAFWKDWAQSLKAGNKCEQINYHVAYPEASNDRVEEITEAKSF